MLPPPPAPRRPDAPRRSSRTLSDVAATAAANDQVPPEKMDTNKVSKPSPAAVTSNKDNATAAGVMGEGVEEAMRELGELEHKLQNAVRRQRLAVETSDLHAKSEPPFEHDIRPKVNSPAAWEAKTSRPS
ncbi:hypothetical protein B0J15DRAFT_553895 [Fusarium solani]|uniref:Uncharacterized protein n=1 Tax=Fusarium solani TaxID=169388 RepID=A0A9P9GG29_FUSSL|nr:uncharacterized protein B0J15DRAFT_553895 [Fusarium solani]KAH7237890.1 hypothetical protein B0J15DRAFT_553895 [Fusarium solani]